LLIICHDDHAGSPTRVPGDTGRLDCGGAVARARDGANTAIFSLETREISDFRLQISDCLLIVDSISHSQNQSAINNQSEI